MKNEVIDFKKAMFEKTVLLKTDEAAAILNCSERTVINLIHEGHIHAYIRSKNTNGIRLLASELKDYIHSMKCDTDNWQE